MAAPRRRATRATGGGTGRRGRLAPLPRAHFRVFVGEQEVGIESLTPLHWLDGGHPDPELRQTVTLRRAVSTDRTLFAWRAAAAGSKGDARDVVIAQLDEPGGKPINVWRLERAVPIRWSGPALDALSGEIAYEELELRYDTISWRRSLRGLPGGGETR